MQAKSFYKQALAVYMKNFRPEHVYVATCCYNLGLVHRQLSDPKQARDCYERALDAYLKKSRLETITWVLYIVSWVT